MQPHGHRAPVYFLSHGSPSVLNDKEVLFVPFNKLTIIFRAHPTSISSVSESGFKISISLLRLLFCVPTGQGKAISSKARTES